MTITEDLCKILGVDMDVPFILTCDSKVINHVRKTPSFSYGDISTYIR